MATTKQYGVAYLLPGREWTVTVDESDVVATETSETYEVFFAASVARGELFTSVTNLPAIGSAHPSFPNLFAQGYQVKEGGGSEKNRYEITVIYQPVSSTGTPEEGTQQDPQSYIEEIGWRSGSVSRDFVVDADTNQAVLNTAGQPFESVPQVDRPSPTWFKTFKTKARQSSYVGYVDCVNASTMTVGGHSCAKDTLRCVQADEERIFNDPAGYKYRYRVALQLMSNMVNLRDDASPTEVGWQMAIVSAGTVQRTSDGLERVTVRDGSGNEVPVSAPVLLDGDGAFDPARTTPYTVPFVAYPRASFPTIFTSEP